MTSDSRQAAALQHLAALCAVGPDRRPGSAGNLAATDYAATILAEAGWEVTQPEFDCLDWYTDGGSVEINGQSVELAPSPYGLGVEATAPIRVIREPADLDRSDLTGAVVVMTDALATEPLTPKAFPFYGSDEHAQIVAALEASLPAAVVAVTGKYPALCGALDPFPLIEDGDFIIPTGNVRPGDAAPLLAAEGQAVTVTIRSERRTARARNVIAARGPQSPRVTVIAHIDSKPGTPGAVDNAAGVVAVLMLAELLAPGRAPDPPVGVELLLVNGEDHYGAPGELDWLAANEGRLDDIVLALNIDGAGYKEGKSAFSTYNLAPVVESHVASTFADRPSLMPGPEFYQSDHAIFAMQGRPAMAITTELVDKMLDVLFHAPTDTPDQVDINLVLDISDAISDLLTTWPTNPE